MIHLNALHLYLSKWLLVFIHGIWVCIQLCKTTLYTRWMTLWFVPEAICVIAQFCDYYFFNITHTFFLLKFPISISITFTTFSYLLPTTLEAVTYNIMLNWQQLFLWNPLIDGILLCQYLFSILSPFYIIIISNEDSF